MDGDQIIEGGQLTHMDRRDYLLMFTITAAALALRAPRLGFPSHKYFDEVYYVPAAHAYLNGLPDPNSVHPPLAKMMMAAGIWLTSWSNTLFGFHLSQPVGWRIAALVTGLLTIPIVYWMGFKMSQGSRIVASLASAFVATDFLHLVECRIAMLDIFLAFWCLVGAALALKFVCDGPRLAPALLSGLAFGAATACKWSGLFAAAGACVAMMVLAVSSTPWQKRLRGYLPAIFALTIGAVFLASYTPLFMRRGFNVAAVKRIERQGDRMIRFRYNPDEFTHRYKSQFWKWPLVLRPVWYYFKTLPGGRRVRGIVCIGSVIFWWGFLFFLVDAGLLALEGDRMRAFLAINYLLNWVLWAISTTGGFIYYMLPDIPFMALVAALTLRDWGKTRPGKWLAVSYCVLVLIGLAVMYPFLIGLSVPMSYFRSIFFIHAWI